MSFLEYEALDFESKLALSTLVSTWVSRNQERSAWLSGTAAYDAHMAQAHEDTNAWGFHGTYETDAGGL